MSFNKRIIPKVEVLETYLKENGGLTNEYNVYFTERPSSTTRRIMLFGVPQTNTFGFVVAPTTRTYTDLT